MQKPDETPREYIWRFDHVRRGICGIPDVAIITMFCANVRDDRLIEELASHQVRTIAELY